MLRAGWIRLFLLLFTSSAVSVANADQASNKEANSDKESSTSKAEDYQSRKGKASYYGKEFFGKKMADGTPMDPDSNIAASRTLPLGTKAEVTNLENGKSEVVEIRDRGPYVDGRIIDVTPTTAENLGFKEEGLAPVEVTPLYIPSKKAEE